MFGRTAESLGREHLKNRETQELGGGALWNQEGRQDHGLLDCSSQPWLKRLKKDPGPNEAWVLGDERELKMGKDWVCH